MVTNMGLSTYSNSLALLKNIGEGAGFLESQADQLFKLWNRFMIMSYYKTKKTATFAKDRETEQYARVGELKDMVKKIWAQLYLSNEDRIPVTQNHTEMVKFPLCTDSTYCSVVVKTKQFVGNIRGTSLHQA
ncbi:hypothetical protein FN846DRAFT_936050 [Sphaerosporella brunnea]|uniref:Uncharacterized protein n=1 Tax=Sphaerosporella brunnea TaxID=1250544 RepID=A0A5J5F5Q3_9PEZI|nr:hypothetical protein FN846DRAFT_936050 [Sphaerosporella brunnea]